MNNLSKALAIVAAFTASSQAASTERLLSMEGQEQRDCTDADTETFWEKVKLEHQEEPMSGVDEFCGQFLEYPLAMVSRPPCQCLDKLFEYGVMGRASPDCYYNSVMSFLESMEITLSSCVPASLNQVVDHHLMSVPGGTCTCPDGSSYQVAIIDADNCNASLSCNGGTMSSCFPTRKRTWIPKYVSCDKGSSTDFKDDKAERPSTIEAYTPMIDRECTEEDNTSVWETLESMDESEPIDGLMEVCGDLINDPTQAMQIGDGCSCMNFLFENELMEMVAPECLIGPDMTYLEFAEFINLQCAPASATDPVVEDDEPEVLNINNGEIEAVFVPEDVDADVDFDANAEIFEDVAMLLQTVEIPETKEGVDAMIKEAQEVRRDVLALLRRLQRQLKDL